MAKRKAGGKVKVRPTTGPIKAARPAVIPPKSSTALSGVQAATIVDTPSEGLKKYFFDKCVALLREVVERAPAKVLLDALSAPAPVVTLASAMSELGVRLPNTTEADQELAAAIDRGTQRKMALLDQADGAWTSAELAEVLEISRQAISDGRKNHLYFGVSLAGNFVFPRCQITTDGEPLRGLRKFLDAFDVDDPWSQLLVLLSPSPRLKNRTPLQALKNGDIEGAVQVASAYGEHGG